MTSRRSRLKAVVNVPVRRKIPTSQEISESKSTENLSPKVSSTLKDNEVGNPPAKINQTFEDQDGVPVENLENNVDKRQVNLPLNDAGDVHNNQENCITDEMKVVNDDISESCDAELLENNNDISKKHNLNNNTLNNSTSSSLRCNRQVKPNLVSSVPHESTQSQITEQNREKLNCQKPSPTTPIGNDTISVNLGDGVNYYNVVNPEKVTLAPVSTFNFTTLTSGIDNTIATASDVNIHAINAEEGKTYTDLGGSTELYINSTAHTCKPIKVVKDACESSEFFIDNEQSEPTFTTLENCTVHNEVAEINLNYMESNVKTYKSETQDLFIKPSVKNGEVVHKSNLPGSEHFFKNSSLSTKDKQAGNQIISKPPNVNFDSDSLNVTAKQSVSIVKKKRSKCNGFTKKLADARREFQKKYEKTKPDRSTLKMIDLIFYNPTTNPMESKNKFDKKESLSIQGEIEQEMLAEEEIDEPEPMDTSAHSQISEDKDSESMSRMPVPQVKIGLNGEIILDEKSLVIETTEAKKGREDLQNSVPVFEDRGSKVSYYRGRTRKTRDWTDFETKRFYKALNTIGPDFSLMQKYFPKRSRIELKNKFKREERLNRNLIDKALNNPSEFDMTQLENDLAVEKRAEEVEMRMRQKVKEKQVLKRPRVKSSRLSREMIESDEESDDGLAKNVDLNPKISEIEKEKKKREINFIFQKFVLKESEKQINELSEVSTPPISVFRPTNHGVT